MEGCWCIGTRVWRHGWGGGWRGRSGMGAWVVWRGGRGRQSQEGICGGRYMSGDDPMRVFAAGDAKDLTIEVTWRSGKRSVVKNAQPNHEYEVDERGAVEVEKEKE